MTVEQIGAWLGIPPGRAPAPWVINALRWRPVPRTDAERIATFQAFIRGAAAAGIKPGRRGELAAYAPRDGEE